MVGNPDYSVGTISITTGTKALTGVGTMWLSADLEKGDEFGFDGYSSARIDTITADGTITLLDTWRGPTLAGSPYFIRYQADGSGLTGQSVALRRMLSQPLITAFAGLAAAADKLMYLTGAGTMALVDFKSWARSFFGLTMAADKLAYGTGANTMGLTDITAAGRALLDDANASAQLDTLGFSAFGKTLIDDANASAAQTTLGITAFIKGLLDDANEAAAFATLGGSFGSTASGSWCKLPGGLIVQWGSNVVNISGGGGGGSVLFPTAFSSTARKVVAWNGEQGSGPILLGKFAGGESASGFLSVLRNSTTGLVVADGGNYRIDWIAAGI